MRNQAANLLRPMRRGRGFRIGTLCLLAAISGAGLPHILATRLPVPSGEPADAILVLAGGEYRIQEGYRIWREGRGKELAILGAGGRGNPERILPGRPSLTPQDLRRLHVENWSENTLENAYSANELASQRKYARVVLVTSGYHVPRAYLTFRKVLPESVSVSVFPVETDWRGGAAFARAFRLYFVEGWKYWWYRIFLLWE